MRPGPGFTLLELLVALAVAAVLAALGWPLLGRQQAVAALTAATQHTLAALQLARRQALVTGHVVTVCPTPDGLRCGFGASQWMLFENLPGGSESRREAGEPLLQRWPMPGGIAVGGTRGYAAYQPTARVASTVTFRFCHSVRPGYERSVIVSQTGRARVSRPPPSTAPAGACP